MANPTTAPTTGPSCRPPTPRPSLRPTPSRKALLGLLLAVGALLSTQEAQAQIMHEKPAQVKAANRRALRETKRTDSPYKDSHLGVTSARLKRGESTQPQPERSSGVNYSHGTAPNVKAPGFLGLRRRKKL